MLYHKPSSPRRVASSLVALAFSLAAVPGLAQPVQNTPDPDAADSTRSPQIEDDLHNRNVDGSGLIVVTAPGLEQLDVLAGTSLVEGRELQREMNGQIGEILAKQPGVSATSFSPGASRPVLRGGGAAAMRPVAAVGSEIGDTAACCRAVFIRENIQTPPSTSRTAKTMSPILPEPGRSTIGVGSLATAPGD